MVVALVIATTCACEKRAPGPGASPDASEVLELRVDGRVVASPTVSEIVQLGTETVTMADPYYGRQKSFVAVPLARVLSRYLPQGPSADDYVFRARDGYAAPISSVRVGEGGAYVAVRDADVPAWEPIGPQRAHPGPLYLVWAKPHQQNLETHPRPWQLASIERTKAEVLYPNAKPAQAAPGSAEEHGFRLFRARCIACHAINREGGRVGPELNVPKNILEYRPEVDVRAYIRNPRTYRYSAMPSHLDLSDEDLDTLIAYFQAMRLAKHDPEGGADAH